jgi:hypothetical protein
MAGAAATIATATLSAVLENPPKLDICLLMPDLLEKRTRMYPLIKNVAAEGVANVFMCLLRHGRKYVLKKERLCVWA